MAGMKVLPTVVTSDKSDISVSDYQSKFMAAMDDDFNSSVLISHLFDAVKSINSIAEGRLKITEQDKNDLMMLMNGIVKEVLGLSSIEETGDTDLTNGLMELILDLRARARSNKDWATSDAIRDQLDALNIVVKDGKEGASWGLK